MIVSYLSNYSFIIVVIATKLDTFNCYTTKISTIFPDSSWYCCFGIVTVLPYSCQIFLVPVTLTNSMFINIHTIHCRCQVEILIISISYIGSCSSLLHLNSKLRKGSLFCLSPSTSSSSLPASSPTFQPSSIFLQN